MRSLVHPLALALAAATLSGCLISPMNGQHIDDGETDINRSTSVSYYATTPFKGGIVGIEAKSWRDGTYDEVVTCIASQDTAEQIIDNCSRGDGEHEVTITREGSSASGCGGWQGGCGSGI